MANELLPFYMPGQTITCHAEAAVTGKTAVKISGVRVDGNPQVSPCGADEADLVFGFAAYDADAGDKVTVYAATLVAPQTVGVGGVTAGDRVTTDATGQAVTLANPGAGATVPGHGIAVDDAAAGEDAPIAFRPTVRVGA